MKLKIKYKESELKEAVKSSYSIAETCRKLNIRPSGGNYNTINKYIKLYDIDKTHFTGMGWNVGLKFKPFKKIPLKDILIKESTYTSTSKLKERLFKDGVKEYKCECCGNIEWMGKKIPLELHHVNGDNTDNRIENLQILCSNCHAQTENFRRGKSISSDKHLERYMKRNENKYIKEKKEYKCECGELINKKSKTCIKCSRLKQRKVDRPELSILLNDIKTLGYRGTGKKYGVSDNTIRKWGSNPTVVTIT